MNPAADPATCVATTTSAAPTTIAVETSSVSAVDCLDVPLLSTTTSLPDTFTYTTTPEEQTWVAFGTDTPYYVGRVVVMDPRIIAQYNGWPDCLDHVLQMNEVVRIPPGGRVRANDGFPYP